jgi:hypothetical protein
MKPIQHAHPSDLQAHKRRTLALLSLPPLHTTAPLPPEIETEDQHTDTTRRFLQMQQACYALPQIPLSRLPVSQRSTPALRYASSQLYTARQTPTV